MLYIHLFCLAVASAMKNEAYELKCRQIKAITIIGKHMCQKACEDLPKCQSLNYDRDQLYCELNDGKANYTDGIGANTTYTYMEKEVGLKKNQ